MNNRQDPIQRVIERIKSEPIIYICDAIGGLRETIKILNIDKSQKLFLLDLVESSQNFANKMEDSLIEKISILKDDGYVKCPECRSWGRPHVVYGVGISCSTCSSPLEIPEDKFRLY
jgi:DNA-directed RNA polymerase subunit RPC12/RpoP